MVAPGTDFSRKQWILKWPFAKFVPQYPPSVEIIEKKTRRFGKLTVSRRIFGVRNKIEYLDLSTDGDLSI